jgi:uncharacterized protein YgbK (DUF1537 family)
MSLFEEIVAPATWADLTAALPAPWGMDPAALAARMATARRVAVLDDDPTGTQSVADLPVLTSWSVDDLRWALQQATSGFFILTNTRSLGATDAVRRNRQIVRALGEAAAREGVEYAVASRGDSTLRGHYPLETDVVAEELALQGIPVDGVIIVPAYIEPGRVTVDSVHWMRTPHGMIPVAQSEFAKDPSFGYHRSDLREWVEEKTGGRITARDVAAITIADLRTGGPDHVHATLRMIGAGRPVVVDAVADDDLQVLATALVRAEAEGRNFVYRTGPSFVRARCGQQATPPIGTPGLRQIVTGGGDAVGPDPREPRASSGQGLIVVGSHVGPTTRQLARVRAGGGIVELVLEVPTLLDPGLRPAHVAQVASRAVALLSRGPTGEDVVIRTSRELVAGTDAAGSLAIARRVSAALVDVVHEILSAVRPRYVVAKGGITASDTATHGLSIRRAWARGTLLPGIVSVWEPATGPARGIPYVVFAGNVGDDDALTAVLATLRSL